MSTPERGLAKPEGQEEAEQPEVRQTGPCVMVIFGATGDLTARKLIPALYNLAKANLLSREFAIVGVAREQLTSEQFRAQISDKIEKFIGEKVDRSLWEWLTRRLYYVSGNFNDPTTYTRLVDALAEVDKAHCTHGNYFFYLAVSPTL